MMEKIVNEASNASGIVAVDSLSLEIFDSVSGQSDLHADIEEDAHHSQHGML